MPADLTPERLAELRRRAEAALRLPDGWQDQTASHPGNVIALLDHIEAVTRERDEAHRVGQQKAEQYVGERKRVKAAEARLAEAEGFIRGLIGLTQLVAGRDDVTDDLRDVLKTNHRVEDAAAFLSPKESTHG